MTGLVASVLGGVLALSAIARGLYRAARALELAGELLRLLVEVARDHEERITKGEQGEWESGNVSPIGPRTTATGSPQRRS